LKCVALPISEIQWGAMTQTMPL